MNMKAGLAVIVLVLCGSCRVPQAFALDVLSGTVTRSAITRISTLFEQQTGQKVKLRFATHPILKKQIEAGERFDVVTIEADMMDELIQQGKIIPAGRTEVARIGMALLAPTGAQTRDMSTLDGFKHALRSVKSIGYVGDGHSGVVFLRTLDRVGLMDELKPKLRPLVGRGCNVAIPNQEVEVCATPAGQVAAGVQMLGRFPTEIQTYVVISAGVATASQQTDAARAFLQFLASPSAVDVFKDQNFEVTLERQDERK